MVDIDRVWWRVEISINFTHKSRQFGFDDISIREAILAAEENLNEIMSAGYQDADPSNYPVKEIVLEAYDADGYDNPIVRSEAQNFVWGEDRFMCVWFDEDEEEVLLDE